MLEGYKEVDPTIFYTFVKEHATLKKDDFMDTDYFDAEGKKIAYRQHGFASDMYYIKSDKDYDTLKFITQLINGKQK